jgi:hypothetical protein
MRLDGFANHFLLEVDALDGELFFGGHAPLESDRACNKLTAKDEIDPMLLRAGRSPS